MNLVREVLSGSKSLLTGMRLTIREFFKPTITTHYPHQTLPIPERYRGHIELKWNEENGVPNCTGCTLCAKACPSDCIDVTGMKVEGEKRRFVDHYILNYTTCSLCSACIEACPSDAIQHTKRYNLASLVNEYHHMDLVERYRVQATEKSKQVYDPKAAHAAGVAAKAVADAAKAAADAAAKAAAAAAAPATVATASEAAVKDASPKEASLPAQTPATESQAKPQS